MRLAFYIARRYLFSRKLPTAVNVITLISMLGITAVTAALIAVLSVFNGFHTLIRDIFEDFDPDIRISAVKGKYFEHNDTLFAKLKVFKGVKAVTKVIEGKALLRYQDKQRIIKLKGVEADFTKVSEINKLIIKGAYAMEDASEKRSIILGAGVDYYISANLHDWVNPMEIYAVSEKSNLLTNDPEKSIRKEQAFPVGVFSLQKEYDEQYVLSAYDMAERLFEAEGKVSAYEICVSDVSDVESMQRQLAAHFGANYKVESWYQQHRTLYEVMKNEKLVGYLVLSLMLILTACNIIGSLTMIVIEKKGDIGMLLALGANRRFIRKVFFAEGLLVGGIACVLGMSFGLLFGVLQENFGLLKLKVQDDNAFIIDYFPVELQLNDFLLTACTVLSLAIVSSIYPAYKASSSNIIQNIKQ